MDGILVSDFDGTMTARDFYDLARVKWPVPPNDDPWEHYVAGKITHFEALANIFARLRAPVDEVREVVARMGLDPGLPAAVARLSGEGRDIEKHTEHDGEQDNETNLGPDSEKKLGKALEQDLDRDLGKDAIAVNRKLEAGCGSSLPCTSSVRVKWRVIVASAGCAWYIEQLLAGVPVEIHANPGVYSPVQGLQMSLPTNSRFYSRETGIDKVAIVKSALASAPLVAFAGDGRPDLAPALLVPPNLRFARGWLADALRARGESFRPFERWSQIADALLQLPPAA